MVRKKLTFQPDPGPAIGLEVGHQKGQTEQDRDPEHRVTSRHAARQNATGSVVAVEPVKDRLQAGSAEGQGGSL